MRRPCYQTGDADLDAITDARNEVIRAWGRETLRVADEVLLGNVQDAVWSDWEQLEEPAPEVEAQPEPEPVVTVEEVKPAPTPRVPKVPKPS